MNNTIIYIIIYIIAIILLFVFRFTRKESFFVAYNNFKVPLNEKETDIKYLNNIFAEYNTLKAQGTSDFPSKESYEIFPYYSKFPLEKTFGDTLMNTTSKIFSNNERYKNDKIEIVKNVYDLYFKNDGKNKNYIFKIDLNDLDKKWVMTFKIFLVFDDVDNYINPLTGDIFDDKKEQPLPINIKNISLDEPLALLDDEISGIDELSNDTYYRIKNTLHLMDPFLTSNKEMVIDNKMKSDFDEKLKELVKSNSGRCFNVVNSNVKNKIDCLDLGGIWDYPPTDSEECPYYRSNKNYPNDFGGLLGNKCQLPKNMQIIGYRNISSDPKYLPLCYNCKKETDTETDTLQTNIEEENTTGTLGFCCDDQKDKNLYPDLITPDYAFAGDTYIRSRYF